MKQPLQRYLVGLIAFVATVTLLTHGVMTTLVALAVCGAVVNYERILAGWARRPRPRVGPRPERMRARPLAAESDAHQLVPDEPSLILTPAEF